MFQIHEFAEATLATLTPRSQKHGDDDVPAVSLGLELLVPNTLLDSIDPCIREALFKRTDGQPELPGVEPSTPALRCHSFERVVLTTKHEGWTLEVDDGIDDTKPKTFGGCKVDKLTVDPMIGGSCRLRVRIGTADIDAERSGMLAMHVGQSIWIKLRAPEKAEDAPAEQGATSDQDEGEARPDATDLFVNAAADEKPGTEVVPESVWPFPNDGPPDKPVTVTKVSRKKLVGRLGSDADQAERQRKALAEDDALAGAK